MFDVTRQSKTMAPSDQRQRREQKRDSRQRMDYADWGT